MTHQIDPHVVQDDVEIEDSEDEAEGDDGLDDGDDTPEFIERLLKNPPILPGECQGEFEQLFEKFEYTHLGRAKTVVESILVFNATTLTWELIRYHRMKVAIQLNQQRGALESLFRKTHEGAAMAGAEAGLRAMASVKAGEWFGHPAHRERAAKRFEAAGYAPNAVEAEAFQRSLVALATIDRLIASAEKRLMSFLKELESRYGARGEEVRLVAVQAVSRASGKKKAKE